MPILLGKELLNSTQCENEAQLEKLVCDPPELLLDEADACDRRRKIALVANQIQLPMAGRLDALFITDDGAGLIARSHLPVGSRVPHFPHTP